VKTRSYPLRALYQRVEQRGREDLPLLSVYRELGVVPREGRDDNHNVASEDLSSYKVVKPGDLVLNKMKTWQGSLGVSNYEGIVSPAYFIGRKVGDVEDRFMHHLLRSAPLIAQYGARSKGIRPGQWDLPWDEFAAIRVEIPSFEDQIRIADFLDKETKRIDELVWAKRRQIKILNERWIALLVQELLGGVTPDSELGEGMWLKSSDPEWEIVPLRRLVTGVVNGSWGEEAGALERDVLCVRAADFNFSILEARDAVLRSYRSSDLVSRSIGPGDLLMEKSGGGDEMPVGRVVQWRGDSAAIPTNFAAKLNISDRATADYVLLLMRALYACGLNYRWIKQTTGIQNLDTGGLLSERVPVPNRNLQASLVRFLQAELSRTSEAMGKLENQVRLLEERRQSLITAAVTGQLEI